MSATLPTTPEEVRAEVSTWLEEAWDPELPLLEWRRRLADSGWACPTWPVEWYGRGLPPDLGRVATETIRAAGAVGPAIGVGMTLAAATLLAHASDDLKRRLLRPMITGEDTWCQLFSEPGNGSDLAGLTTHARRDGDEWVVSGQKVWTTGAHHAAYGMLLARTDWDQPKHRGISFFAFPMRQPGVEVRPLRQMNGRASFNEVFIDEARVPHENLVGDLNDGWRVAQTTLAHERGLAAGLFGAIPPGGGGRTREEAAAEASAYLKTYEWYPQRAGRVDLVVPRARAHGREGDPLVRQAAAALHATERTARWTADRAVAARRAGRPPGPEGSIGKLSASRISREAAAAHSLIAGAHAMLTGPDSPENGIIAEILVSVPGQSIAGGTDEVQHNILGERILGLPKEPSVDADVPFRQVKVNQGRTP
ncbi:MAG TPA: acyl-CoA dehydrogenase family protein [Acidimicrobiales bacterium]|nr:acyl-CoA dehydrogenase family protein [Acidimicrobiales bacterium]